MTTTRLFESDSYLKKFQAEVLSCEKCGEATYEILLNQTAFFPEGGGQSGDRGWLDQIRVLDTYEREGNIYHKTEVPIKVGTVAEGKLDFPERFDKMQQHTGEHILCGIVHRLYGYENVGFHLGEDVTTMDFDGELTVEQLKDAEYRANQAIFENHGIRAYYPSEEELEKMDYRSKNGIKGKIRLVEISHVDLCACCVPHLRSTAEVGILKVIGYERHRGGSRLTILCGMRALADYQKRQEIATKISGTLSAKQDQIYEAVQHLLKQQQSLREQLNSVQARYLEEKLDQIREKDPSVLIFEQDMDPIAMRNFVNSAMERCAGICGAFLGSDETGYRYILGSKTVDLRQVSSCFNQRFSGKGGGKPQMVQGSLQGSEIEIRKIFGDNLWK